MPWAATCDVPPPVSALASAFAPKSSPSRVSSCVCLYVCVYIWFCRYACVLQAPPRESPAPIQELANSLRDRLASSSSTTSAAAAAAAASSPLLQQYHVLCTHQDQVMELTESAVLLAGNHACKHGMVRFMHHLHTFITHSDFIAFTTHPTYSMALHFCCHTLCTSSCAPQSRLQLAYAANAMSLQGDVTQLFIFGDSLFVLLLCAQYGPALFRVCEALQLRVTLVQATRSFRLNICALWAHCVAKGAGPQQQRARR